MPQTINSSDIDDSKISYCCKVERIVKCQEKDTCKVSICYFRDLIRKVIENKEWLKGEVCTEDECEDEPFKMFEGKTYCKKHYINIKFGVKTIEELIKRRKINFIESAIDRHRIIRNPTSFIREFCILTDVNFWEPMEEEYKGKYLHIA